MEAIIGTAASIITLQQSVEALWKFCDALKHAPEQLRTYRMVLKCILISMPIVSTLAKQNHSAQTTPPNLNGEIEECIKICSSHLNTIVNQGQQLVQNVEDVQSPSTKSVLQPMKRFFRRQNLALKFIIHKDRIKILVESAFHALSVFTATINAVQTAQNYSNRDGPQEIRDKSTNESMNESIKQAINECIQTVDGHSQSLQKLQRIWERRDAPAIIVQAAAGGVREAESRKDDITPSESALIRVESELTRTEILEREQNLAVVRQDGTFEVLDNRPQGDSSDSPHHADLITEDRVHVSSTGAGNLLISKDLSEDDVLSEENDIAELTIIGHPVSSSQDILYDSEEFTIGQHAIIFLDRAITITNCRLPTGEGFRFCVATFIIHEGGYPVLILKEPCSFDSHKCQHISVRTPSGSSFDYLLPCSLRAILGEKPIPTGNNRAIDNHPAEEQLKLIVLRDCNDRSSRTLVLGLDGFRTQYAVQMVLCVSVLGLDESEERDGEGDGTASESSSVASHVTSEPQAVQHIKIGDDNGIPSESSGAASPTSESQVVIHCGTNLLRFSSLPCFFCRQDALRPQQNADGAHGWLVMRSDYFGYRCDRCRDRTWVSGTQFGLTGVGGAWSFWN